MKRTISLLSFLLILLLLPIPAAAASDGVTEALSTVAGLSPLEEALYRGMMATEERIDVSAYGASAEEITAAMQHLSDGVPELFHVARSYKYSTKAVIPTYLYTGDALAAARAEYLLALDLIAEGVDPAWSDAEICLYLHDYLCRTFAYDIDLEIFDAYRFLTEGRGVCQSYTLTYTALLSRFGIPVTYATGEDGGVPHIWNIVMLDGEYYHVDVTWGDALSEGRDYFARATHDNFLKSDAAIDATGHGARKNRGGIVCDSTLYDGSALSEVTTSAAFLDGVPYAIANGRVYCFENGLSAAPRTVYTVAEEWQSGIQILNDKPAGLVAYGDTLYVNTPTAVCALDPASGYTEVLFSVDRGMILTIAGTGDALRYAVADNVREKNKRVLTYTLPSSLPPCTAEHIYEVYATAPASCAADGVYYKKCTLCGDKTTEAIPALPHTVTVTVIPPGFGSCGYTERLCTVCGHSETGEETPALPLPTAGDYRAAVAEAKAATTPYGRLTAIRTALSMEPHLDEAEIRAEYTALRAVMAAYDTGAADANRAHADAAPLLFFTDFSFFTGAGTLMLLLFLAIRRTMGL